MSKEKVNSENTNKQFQKRKKKYVRPDVQNKIILCTFLVGLFTLLVNIQIPLLSIFWMRTTFQPLFYSFLKLLFLSFGVSLLISIPLSIWVGIVISFHFFGPIYHIKKHFEMLKKGRWDARCKLREKDELKDVVEEINSFFDISNDLYKKQHTLLNEALTFLQETGVESVDTQKLEELKQQVEEATTEFNNRLGNSNETPAPETGESTGTTENTESSSVSMQS